MKAFRRSVRRFRRAKKELMWVRVEGSVGALAGGGNAIEALLISGATWARQGSPAGTVQKGCVLLRSIVTWTAYMVPSASPASAVEGDAGFVGLRRCDQDDQAVLNSGVDYLDEDWMHVDWWEIDAVYAVNPTLTWADRTNSRWTRTWDSKVKRKLTSEDDIRLSAARSSAIPVSFTPNGTFYVDFFTRFLLQLP